jgi:multidrug efflux system outer membrane protein
MPHRRSFVALGLISSLFVASVAQAQPAKPAKPPTPAAPAAPAPAPTPQAEPVLPEPTDPLLEPPPPPAHVLSTWQDALKQVREQSVSMRIARANVLQAEGLVRQALAPALPQLLGTAGVTKYLIKGDSTIQGVGRIPDPSLFWSAQLGLTVPLFRPAAWYNYGSAKEALEATRLSTQETERQLVAGVADLIVSVVTAERLAEVSRTSLKAALATVDLTKRRAALGASNTLDVLRVEGEASLSRSQVVQSTEALIRAREALGSALGSADSWGIAPGIQIEQLSADAQQVCHTETDIAARTDVRAANANLGVAERHVKGVDYAYLPTVDAVSALSFQDPRFAVNNKNVSWTIGALLTWNIYDGGLRGGQRTTARAEVEAAQANLAETRRGASLQVAQALRAVQVAEANLAVSAKTREIDAETARLSKISFLNGSGTSFDLVTTESLLRVAEADLAVKEFDVTQAKIAALLALSTCSLP